MVCGSREMTTKMCAMPFVHTFVAVINCLNGLMMLSVHRDIKLNDDVLDILVKKTKRKIDLIS